MEDDDSFKTCPQHTISRLKGNMTMYKYLGFWNIKSLHEGTILARKSFKAKPSDVLISSCPKTDTTWLKTLAFAIVTRDKFDGSTTQLLTTLPHECIPLLEHDLEKVEDNHNNAGLFPLVATHLPYTSLPESLVASDCKIVYIYRDVKDVIVSHYCFLHEVVKLFVDDVPFEYWDHIWGYWKASQERLGRILFLKYEDMKEDPTNDVKRLAEFIGYLFSIEEEKAGVVENIIKLCSFENMSNLEVNKSGTHRPEEDVSIENRLYFKKAKDGDWENYFTDEKLSGTGLVLK
ncbi:hypothetical protein L6452_37465 [Arctium lappa]|uniref:Uncharacterized protein n=1 Tax=Arctium lappa TaxID=4217 RepID=A0ACB8Y3Q5_ARCLA|nr:hypothetical protein L6452_37465 [Arctium lappa]